MCRGRCQPRHPLRRPNAFKKRVRRCVRKHNQRARRPYRQMFSSAARTTTVTKPHQRRRAPWHWGGERAARSVVTAGAAYVSCKPQNEGAGGGTRTPGNREGVGGSGNATVGGGVRRATGRGAARNETTKCPPRSQRTVPRARSRSPSTKSPVQRVWWSKPTGNVPTVQRRTGTWYAVAVAVRYAAASRKRGPRIMRGAVCQASTERAWRERQCVCALVLSRTVCERTVMQPACPASTRVNVPTERWWYRPKQGTNGRATQERHRNEYR